MRLYDVDVIRFVKPIGSYNLFTDTMGDIRITILMVKGWVSIY